MKNGIIINELGLAESIDEFQGFIPEYDEVMPLFLSMCRRTQALNLSLEEIILMKAISVTTPGQILNSNPVILVMI